MISLAIILGCVALWLAWRRPTWGALAVFAILPAYQWRFSTFGLPSTVLEAVLLATIIGSGLHWWQRRSAWPRLGPGLLWAAGLWLLIGLGGIWVAADRTAALGLYRAYIVEPVLLLPVWLAVARDANARRQLVHVASVLLVVLASVAVGQRLGWLDALAPWAAEQPPRMTSVFPYPNAAALFTAPLAAFIAGVWLTLRKQAARWERALWIIGTFSGLVVCALAVSRGALLALGIAAVVAGAWSMRRWLWWGICAIAVIALLVVPSTRQQFTRIITTTDTSTDVRAVLWEGTWHMLRDRPLQGAGLGAFPDVYDRYRLPQHVELLQYPHNLFLNVWSELGLIGLLFTLSAFFWLSLRLFHRLRRREAWAVGALLAWIVLVVHGMVDVPFFKNDLAVLTVGLAVLAAFAPVSHNKIPPA